MSNFVTHLLDLTDRQKKELVKAFKNKIGAKIRLKHKQLTGGNDELMLNPLQIRKIQTAIRNGKGLVLNLTDSHIDKTYKRGGFLPKLIGTWFGPALKDFGEDIKAIQKGKGMTEKEKVIFLQLLEQVLKGYKQGEGIPKSSKRLMNMAVPGIGSLVNFVVDKVTGKSGGCSCKGDGLFLPGTILHQGGDGLLVPGGSIATAKIGDIGVFNGHSWNPATVGVYNGDGVFQDLDEFLSSTDKAVKKIVKEKVIPKAKKIRQQVHTQAQQAHKIPDFITAMVEKKKI